MTTQRSEIRKRLTRALRDLEAVEREIAVFTNSEIELDLVGSKEAAEILGVQPQTLSARLARGNFPVAPVARLACGPIWHRADIEALT